jgi:NADP-dependent 3-hydroxy acid dehydrogenase YdfG
MGGTVKHLNGKIAWVTGAGSGIGEAAAIGLARAGASVVLTGRRAAPLEDVARRIKGEGGTASAQPGDLMQQTTARRIAETIRQQFGRLDILVNNAGLNIVKRSWRQLEEDGADEILRGNLASAFYCVIAALPMMRAQKDGVLIHTASWAGRFVSPVSGPAYTAAKHGVVAMSHSINGEECMNGIRSSVICPAEVATPILDKRPVPVSAEERARMLQPEDLGYLICYIATLPKHVCLNEVLISPTWNRGYVATLQQAHLKV